MSAATMAEAWAPVEAVYREAVTQETWGHLAPEKNKTYLVTLVYAVGIFGDDSLNPTVLQCDLSGGLDSSPWLYEALQDFLWSFNGQNDEGGVYRFVGKLRNYKFRGTRTKIEQFGEVRS